MKRFSFWVIGLVFSTTLVADPPAPRPAPVLSPEARDRGKLVPGRRPASAPPVEVEIPDMTKLPWEMRGGAKEFHLYAKHTRREFLPYFWADTWGFNDQMPGPAIEVTEGDRVRIVVHNQLPEAMTVHWHGLEVPIDQDGVDGLTQNPIRPGETYTYEFDLHQNGTFFYHAHDGMQDGMGMVGLFIIHPKRQYEPPVDRDIALVIQEWAFLPGQTIPNTVSMEFNIFTINGRTAPYTTPIAIRRGDRVRLRLVNFSAIDHHPIHLHGNTFWIAGTEAGRIPESAWIPSNNVLVGVAQARDIEYMAENPGDWMLHCHMFHHMMNFMSTMTKIVEGGVAERVVGTMLPRPAHANREGMRTPGYPQGMVGMNMFTPREVRKIRKPETVGMRPDWFTGVSGLMTVVRTLPEATFDKYFFPNGRPRPIAAEEVGRLPDNVPPSMFSENTLNR